MLGRFFFRFQEGPRRQGHPQLPHMPQRLHPDVCLQSPLLAFASVILAANIHPSFTFLLNCSSISSFRILCSIKQFHVLLLRASRLAIEEKRISLCLLVSVSRSCSCFSRVLGSSLWLFLSHTTHFSPSLFQIVGILLLSEKKTLALQKPQSPLQLCVHSHSYGHFQILHPLLPHFLLCLLLLCSPP